MKSIINVVATLALTVAFVKVADASRKPNLTAHQQREALQRRDAGEPTREIARTYKRASR